MFFSCNSYPEYQKVLLNKTLKVYSEEYHDSAENYLFKWTPPNDPNGKPVRFDLKQDMFIFTPNIEGTYEIHLSITDISNEIVAEEVFYYEAISSPTLSSNNPNSIVAENDISLKIQEENKNIPTIDKKINDNKNKKTKNILKKQNKRSKKKKNVSLTIQIASWPTLEEARKNQLELIELGIDTYIERFYRTEKDIIWYRVRAGNFRNKEKAIKFQKQIESIIGQNNWLDSISNNKK